MFRSIVELFIDSYCRSIHQWVSWGFRHVLLGFIGFYRALQGFTGFYWVLQGFTGFYWVLLGFTGFYWVLLCFTGFYGVFAGRCRIFTDFLSQLSLFDLYIYHSCNKLWFLFCFDPLFLFFYDALVGSTLI